MASSSSAPDAPDAPNTPNTADTADTARMAEFIMFTATKLAIDCAFAADIKTVDQLTANPRNMKGVKLLFLRSLAIYTVASGHEAAAPTDARKIATYARVASSMTSGVYEHGDVSWMSWGLLLQRLRQRRECGGDDPTLYNLVYMRLFLNDIVHLIDDCERNSLRVELYQYFTWDFQDKMNRFDHCKGDLFTLKHSKLTRVLASATREQKRGVWAKFVQFMAPTTIPMTLVLRPRDENTVAMAVKDVQYIRNTCWREARKPVPSKNVALGISQMLDLLNALRLPSLDPDNESSTGGGDEFEGLRDEFRHVAVKLDHEGVHLLYEISTTAMEDYVRYQRQRLLQARADLPREIKTALFMRMNPRIRADQVPDFSAPPEKDAAFVHRWIRQRKEIRGEIEDETGGG